MSSVIVTTPAELEALISKVFEKVLTGSNANRTPAEYLSPSSLAIRMAVSRATVHRWLNRGLPCIGNGKSRRIKFEVAENWLRERSQIEAQMSGQNDAAAVAARRLSRTK